MNDSPDDRIVAALSEQRRADEAAAPEFDSLLARPRRQPSVRVVRSAFAVAAVLFLAAALAWFVSRSRSTSEPSPSLSLAAWRAPTDSLLETPGTELLKEVPELAPAVPMFPRIDDVRSEKSRTPAEKS